MAAGLAELAIEKTVSPLLDTQHLMMLATATKDIGIIQAPLSGELSVNAALKSLTAKTFQDMLNGVRDTGRYR